MDLDHTSFMLGAAVAVGLRKAQNWFWTLSLIFNSLSGLVLLALQCPVDWGSLTSTLQRGQRCGGQNVLSR
jgi:hypothetical protein